MNLRAERTLQAQFAASFATLVSPPTLGAVAVNARFLNRSGLPPAEAAFRTVTFWLPTVPGWFAFRGLTAKGLL